MRSFLVDELMFTVSVQRFTIRSAKPTAAFTATVFCYFFLSFGVDVVSSKTSCESTSLQNKVNIMEPQSSSMVQMIFGDNIESGTMGSGKVAAFCGPMSVRFARDMFAGSCRQISRRLQPRRGMCTPRRGFLDVDEDRIARHAQIWKLGRESQVNMTSDAMAPTPTTTGSDQETETEHRLLDGKATAASIREEIATHIKTLVSKHGEHARPSLAVVIVGNRPDSSTYVQGKHKACKEVGISSEIVQLDEKIEQAELESTVTELNKRGDVDGILVQLPLPSHIDEERVLSLIDIEKDVDGFHPLNVGSLCMSGRSPPLFVPCTPRAVVELLDRYDVAIDGQRAAVIGRSNIVGLPVAMLLMHRNATVTICHSRTADLEQHIREADIVVAACGRANFVKGEWIKKGAVVVDVGVNAVEDKSRKKGYRLVGDVEFDTARQNARLITPVPGGVGPMTITMLLSNTLTSARRRVS